MPNFSSLTRSLRILTTVPLSRKMRPFLYSLIPCGSNWINEGSFIRSRDRKSFKFDVLYHLRLWSISKSRKSSMLVLYRSKISRFCVQKLRRGQFFFRYLLSEFTSNTNNNYIIPRKNLIKLFSMIYVSSHQKWEYLYSITQTITSEIW
jgi:hypothetical protein